MVQRRLFTKDEQERTDERIHDISQAFIWTGRKTLCEKFTSFAKYPLIIAIILLCAIVGIAALIGSNTSSTDLPTICITAAFVTLIIEAIIFIVVFTFQDEKDKSSPPIFLFFHEKLFYFQDDGTFSISNVNKISRPEISILRKELPSILNNMTNSRIESECYYIKAAKEYELGNDISGLNITVIDNIVDVSDDEENEQQFIITYENDYDEEIELYLNANEWSELYQWFYEQMYAD